MSEQMEVVESILEKLLDQYSPEWIYQMGSPTGYKCSWCGVVIPMRGVFDDPEQHDRTCPYRAALEWWIRGKEQ